MDNQHPEAVQQTAVINGNEYPLYIVSNKDYIPKNILDNDEIKYVVKIPEGTVEIPEKAFSECKGLYAVITPKSNTIKTIGSYAFENCENLTIMTSEK
jgi:hypothetical protein